MPTIILLDMSLSMSVPVPILDQGTEQYLKRHLAIHAVNSFLDYCTLHSKLEFVSLVVFSSLWEQLSPFTRDYDNIKTALNKIGDYDTTCLESALTAASSAYTDEWGLSSPGHVIVITDGCPGVGSGSLKHSLQTLGDRGTDDKFPLPFKFPAKLDVLCIASSDDSNMQTFLPLYERLVNLNDRPGSVHTADGALSLKSVHAMVTSLCEQHFTPFFGSLKCGNLKCNVQIIPAIQAYEEKHDFETVQMKVSETLEICGFIDIADIASPPSISRHLILPVPVPSNTNSDGKKSNTDDDDEDQGDNNGKTAAFTVLLHGSLKVESMIAITQLAEDWFGIIYSWADSKKKSNLMISVFQPGNEVISWLGKINYLAPIGDFHENPYGEDDESAKSPFPVRPADRRSYAQNCVVWIKPSGIQADVQKILRHARKLPEKQQNFYKDLNRLRRAALSFGFHELLEALAAMLERECTILPGTAHPDAALQLTHAANALRSEQIFDITHNIMPMRTNFTSD